MEPTVTSSFNAEREEHIVVILRHSALEAAVRRRAKRIAVQPFGKAACVRPGLGLGGDRRSATRIHYLRRRARLVRLALGGFQLLRIEEDAPRKAVVTVPQDRVMIAFPILSADFQVWRHEVMRPCDLMLLGPGASFRHTMSRAGGWAWIVVDRKTIAEDLVGQRAGPSRFWHPPPSAKQGVRQNSCGFKQKPRVWSKNNRRYSRNPKSRALSSRN